MNVGSIRLQFFGQRQCANQPLQRQYHWQYTFLLRSKNSRCKRTRLHTMHTKIIKHKTNQPSPPSPYSSYYTIAITRPPIKASISPSTPHRASGRLGLHISRLALHIASRPSSRLACHITRRTTSHTNGHRRQRYNQPAITLHRLPRLPKPCPSTSRCRITTTCVAPGTSLRRIPAYIITS